MNEIYIGSYTIRYEIAFSKRKTLGILVKSDTSVLVRAPKGLALDKIAAIVKKKATWILKKQSFFKKFQPKILVKQYVSGESFYYLGRQYRLKIEKSEKQPPNIQIFGGFIHILSSDTSPEKIEILLEKWYQQRAKAKIIEIVEPLFWKFVKKHNLPIEQMQLSFRKMRSRWGSCSSKGKIILNTELIKVPKACIEYVMIHELCHLVHHNHSKHFYQLQSLEMYDWQKWKNKLEQYKI